MRPVTPLVRMRPALRQRLHFIECMLLHYGTINRSVVMDFFGLSSVQASGDLQHYLALAPANAEYDLGAKTYRRGPTFQRLFDE